MVVKSKTSFVCQECGYESAEWLGKCPECGSWNSLREFKIQKSRFDSAPSVDSGARRAKVKSEHADVLVPPQTLSQISSTEAQRLSTGYVEMDTVMGGGIVKGSVSLIAGDPGVGKSTLLLQVALSLAWGPATTLPTSTRSRLATPYSVLYVSGEESTEQIKLRANRLLNTKNNQGKVIYPESFYVMSTTSVELALDTIYQLSPNLIIIDSVQTMESEQVGGLAGSVAQIRFSTATFIKVAKQQGIPVILVGHVTKEGMVAGPMLLSHMVDSVLFFEGEKTTNTRILRSLKNRFGPVDEVGVFTMEETGIGEIKNPEHIFLSDSSSRIPGSVLSTTLEGTRAFLVELQALVVSTRLPMPRRVASGIDTKRLELLLAVLQKHCRLPVDTMDIFINVAGGLKLTDRAVDLGVCLSIFASIKNVSLEKTVAIGEVGLLGELRAVPFLDKRIKEAEKLGFKNIITPKKYKTLVEVIQALS